MKKSSTKRARPAIDLLHDLAPKEAIAGGVPLSEWLRNQAGEWALQYVNKVFPELKDEKVPLLFAAEASFKGAIDLACCVLHAGKLDKSYGALWNQLLEQAKKDVEDWQTERLADESSESVSQDIPGEEHLQPKPNRQNKH